MKRLLLLGVLLFAINISYSQSIDKPSIAEDIVCTGSDQIVRFDIDETSGKFDAGSNFSVQLSDTNGNFGTYTVLGTIPYKDGVTTYQDAFFIDYTIPESVTYKIRIVSSSPKVISPSSTKFNIVFISEIIISANGPTEFCDGGSVELKSDRFANNQWYKDGAIIPGETGETYVTSESGIYHVDYTSQSCTASSNKITVVKTFEPISKISPDTDQEICLGDTFTFSAVSENTESPKYNWLDENDNIVGTGDKFTVGKAGTYRLETLNYGVCSNISQPVTLVVRDFVAEIVGGSPVKSCVGTDVVLVSKEKDGAYIYHWFKDNVEIAVVQPATDLIIAGVETGSGIYRLEIESASCTNISNEVEVSIKPEPVAKIVESDQKGCEGDVVTLTSKLVDADYDYQWFFKGGLISGANKTSINVTLSSKTSGDYTLEIGFGTSCSDLSAPVNLEMVETPVSIINPTGEVITCGSSMATLNAASTNVVTPTYVWIDASDKEVGTGDTYITGVSGDYRLVTFNEGSCSDTSAVTTVIISPKAISKISPDTDQEACDRVVLTQVSENLGDIDRVTFRWLDKADNEVGTGKEFIATVSGEYRLETLNYGVCGSISNPVKVTITDFVAKIAGDAVIKECEGNEILLESVEKGSTYTYKWFKDGVELTGLTQPATTLKLVGDMSDAGEYTLFVETTTCKKTSDPVEVIISKSAISKISPDTDQSDCYEVVLSAVSENIENPQYRWLDAAGNELGTSKTYKVTVSGEYFLETLNNGMCGNISAPVNVTISDFTPVIAGDKIREECEGNSVLLESSITNASYIYQWNFKGSPINGANSSSYTVLGNLSNNGLYSLTIDNGSCEKTSVEVEVIIKKAPVAKIVNGTGETSCEGSEIILKSELTDLSYTYNWYLNGSLIGNENAPELKVVVSNSTVGAYRLGVIFGTCNESFSDNYNLSMESVEAKIVGDADRFICEGESVILKVVATGTSLEYAWIMNGSVIDGETSSELTVSGEGFFKSRVTSNGICSVTTEGVNVAMVEDRMGVDNSIIEIAIGESAVFRAYGGEKYEWYKDGMLVYEGSDTFSVSPKEDTEYQVKITSEYNCDTIIDLKVIVVGITSKDIMNLITPNGDGKNDVWILPDGIAYSSDVEITILTRQGSIVLQTMNYQNNWGGDFNGSLLPAATYYYVIKFTDGREPIMGSISIFNR